MHKSTIVSCRRHERGALCNLVEVAQTAPPSWRMARQTGSLRHPPFTYHLAELD